MSVVIINLSHSQGSHVKFKAESLQGKNKIYYQKLPFEVSVLKRAPERC